MTLKALYEILKQVGIPVYHYEAALEDVFPYIVYEEQRARYTYASGAPYDEIINVSVWHLTKTEFDPSFERLKEVLINSNLFFNAVMTFDRTDKVLTTQMEVEINGRASEIEISN